MFAWPKSWGETSLQPNRLRQMLKIGVTYKSTAETLANLGLPPNRIGSEGELETAKERAARVGFLVCACYAATILVCLTSASVAAQDAQQSQEWTTVNKDYSSQRYVNLDQITPAANVGTLKEVCEARLNEPSWFSSGVLMVGRTLYVTTLRATYADYGRGEKTRELLGAVDANPVPSCGATLRAAVSPPQWRMG